MGRDQFAREIPENQKSKETILQIQEVLQDEYNAIMRKHGLDYVEGARAGTIVCAMLLNYFGNTLKKIDLAVGASILANGFMSGAKISPVPLRPGDPTGQPENGSKRQQAAGLIRTIAGSSISGSGARLVLGEKSAVVRDALDNGDKFILLHPDVANQLSQANYDVFLVHLTGLMIEMESKIATIDFVGINVDESLKEWGSQPSDQAPIPARLVLWLQENAAGYGYQRSGNSWVLSQ